MTPEEIIEGNRLIAEFMGAKYRVDTYMMYEMPDDLVATLGCMCFEQLDKMKFHSSWDWLMPVVEKIEMMYNEALIFYIKDKRAYIEVDTQARLVDDTIPDVPQCYSGFCSSKIEAVYITVIEFIKWYNQTKK